VETREKVVTVPSEAVMPGLDGQFCYVVKNDQTVEPRTIRSGPVIEGRTLIEEGLKVGESIVVTGQGKLKPGARIVARKKAS
jgi:multidrug efflux system membrane fusion protein